MYVGNWKIGFAIRKEYNDIHIIFECSEQVCEFVFSHQESVKGVIDGMYLQIAGACGTNMS